MNELQNAQRRIEEGRHQIDETLSELENRFDSARDQLRDSFRELREVPKTVSKYPVAKFGVFLLAGFMLGSWISERNVPKLAHDADVRDPLQVP